MSAVNSSASLQSTYVQSLSQAVAAQKQLKAQSQSAAQAKLRPAQVQDSVKLSDEAREAFKNLKSNLFNSLVTGGASVDSATKDQASVVDSAFKPSTVSQSTDTKIDTLVSKGTLTKAQEGIIKSVLKSAMLQTQPNTANTAKPNPLDSLVANGTITQDQESSINIAFEAAKKAYLR